MHTTPVVIRTILHVYCNLVPWPNTSAVAEAKHRLRQYGLIQPYISVNEGSGYQCTERGLCWINMLLNTPLPTSAFIDPRSDETVSPEFRVGPGAPVAITDPEKPVNDEIDSYLLDEKLG